MDKRNLVPLVVQRPRVRGEEDGAQRNGMVEEVSAGWMALNPNGALVGPNRKARRAALREARLRAKFHRKVGQPKGKNMETGTED